MAKCVIHIHANKRELCVSAHTARSLKGKITHRTVTEVQCDPLGAKHGLGLFLHQGGLGVIRIAVEDTREIEIEHDITEIGYDGIFGRLLIFVAVQNTHGLKEDGIVLLPCLAVTHQYTCRLGFSKIKGIYIVANRLGMGELRCNR